MRYPLAVALLALAGPLAVRAADEDKWSTVKGRVVFDDSKHAIPKRAAPALPPGFAAPACLAKDKGFLTEDWVVDPKTKGVRDAFVWLAPEPTEDEWKRLKTKGEGRLLVFPSFKAEQLHPDLKKVKPKEVEIDQPCCRFIPHVLGIRTGQTLVVKNAAAFAHNFRWETENNKSGNELIQPNAKIEIPFAQPERRAVPAGCNIHPWMSATIRVFDHPYFAITNENGEYEIKQAPVGKYRIFVWHTASGFSGKADGRFGYELTITPKATDVKPYSVTLDDKPAKDK